MLISWVGQTTRESEASILGNDREREFPLTPAIFQESGYQQGSGKPKSDGRHPSRPRFACDCFGKTKNICLVAEILVTTATFDSFFQITWLSHEELRNKNLFHQYDDSCICENCHFLVDETFSPLEIYSLVFEGTILQYLSDSRVELSNSRNHKYMYAISKIWPRASILDTFRESGCHL